jgi:hypothetical protein
LQSLYDVGQTRAVDVANERLQRMASAAESIRSIVTVGTTTANTSSYALATNVVQVYRVRVAYTSGTVDFSGIARIEDLWDIDAGNATGCGNYYVTEPDTDSSGATTNLRLYPTPTVSGATITALASVIPTALTYTSATALPIPLDCHEHLLAGCKAELTDEENSDSSKFEAVFEAGVKRLQKREQGRGKGSDGHRLRMSGYDFSRMG